jgi:hypothetical protein
MTYLHYLISSCKYSADSDLQFMCLKKRASKQVAKTIFFLFSFRLSSASNGNVSGVEGENFRFLKIFGIFFSSRPRPCRDLNSFSSQSFPSSLFASQVAFRSGLNVIYIFLQSIFERIFFSSFNLSLHNFYDRKYLLFNMT